MIPSRPLQLRLLTYLLSVIWMVNGLICKVLNLVPRHQQIVAEILGDKFSGLFTVLIGISEVFMGIWILSMIRPRFCATAQIILVAVMNILEFVLVPGLLLFGRMNIVFSFFLMGIIYYNGFVLYRKP